MRQEYERFLLRWGLVSDTAPTFWQAVKQTKLTFGLGDYAKAELNPAIPLSVTEIDSVIYSANKWLDERKSDLWICLDGLDQASVNGGHSNELEDLLSNLMRSVSDLIRLQRIRFKLFFRTDIYNALTYVNKDHFGALKLILSWSKEDLAILLGYRLSVIHESFTNPINYYLALSWINEFFEWSEKGVAGFDDLYQRLMDGNGDVLPRDLVIFCNEAQKQQLNYNIQGVNEAKNGRMVSQAAVMHALRLTASSKLNDFLNVFKNFRDSYDLLKGYPSRHLSRQELSDALGKPDKLDANSAIADLVRVGAIRIKDRKSVNLSNSFEIPYLYSLALDIGETEE